MTVEANRSWVRLGAWFLLGSGVGFVAAARLTHAVLALSITGGLLIFAATFLLVLTRR